MNLKKTAKNQYSISFTNVKAFVTSKNKRHKRTLMKSNLFNCYFNGLFIVALSAALIYGQAPANQDVITNDVVISLSKAKVSPKVIIEMLKTSKLKVDTTSSGIIALTAAGVNEDVISAMRSLSSASVSNTTATSSVTGPYAEKDLVDFEQQNTLILIQGNKRIILGPTTASSRIKTKGLGLAMVTGVGLKLINQFYIPGKSAQTQTDALPKFHFSIEPDNLHARPYVSVIKFKVNTKDNRREIESPDGDFLLTDIASSSDQAVVVLTRVQKAVIGGHKSSIWELSFSKRLVPGEYAVIANTALGKLVFDFSVPE